MWSVAVIAFVALLAVGDVAIYVETVRGASTASTASVLERVAEAVEARTKERAELHATDWVDCTNKLRGACVEEIRAKNRGGEVITLVVVAGITKLRVLAVRHAGEKTFEASIDLPAEAAELERFAATLYPVVADRSAPSLAARAVEAPPEPLHLASWIAIGACAATGALAIAFELDSASTHDELTRGIHTPAEFDALESDRATSQRIATGFLIAAGTSAVTAVVFRLLDL